MPARVIDTATVEIVPDTSALAQVQRKVDQQLRGATQVFDRFGDDVDQVFKEIGRDADRTFNEMQRDIDHSLDRVVSEAVEAGAAVDESLSAGAEGAERSFEELSRGARRQMNEIERKATATAAETGAKFKAMGAVAGAAFVGIGVAAGAALAAVTGFGLISAAQLEQTRISFNALLGSAEKGQEVFAELQKFAAVTPFEFPEVAAAAKRFFAFNDAIGMTDDQVFDFLTTVGDLASVTGAGAEGLNRIALALGQISSKGKVSLEELMQIGEAVPGFSAIRAIAEELGVTTGEAMALISKGAVDAETGVAALLKGMKEFPGAAGAMEKQSQTLLGVFSTFKDTLSQTLAGAFEPVIPAIKESLTEITPILGDALGVLGPALGNLLATVLPALGALIQGVVPILTPIIDVFAQISASVDGVIAPLGSIIGALVGELEPLAPVIGDILATVGVGFIRILETFRPLFDALGEVLPPLLEALLPIVDQLSGIIAQSLAPIIQVLADVITVLAPPITRIVEVIGDLLAPILDELAPLITEILEAFEPLIPVLDDILLPVIDLIVALTPLIQIFSALIRIITPILIPMTKLQVAIFKFIDTKVVIPLLQLLVTVLNGLLIPINLLIPLLETVGNWLTNIDWGETGRQIAGFFTAGWEAARKFVDFIARNVIGLPRVIADKFIGIKNDVIGVFDGIGRGIKGAFTSAFNAVARFWNSTVGSLRFEVPSFIPGIGGKGWDVPDIPTLAHGGMAFGPAIIGEDSSTTPEIALPLNDARAMSALISAINAAGGTSNGDTTIIVEIDGQQLQGRIVKTINEHDRQVRRRQGAGAR